MNWKFWERKAQLPVRSLDPRKAQRAFAAAMMSRLTSGWISQSTSLDAEIKTSLVKLRDRSRQLGRDNDYVVNIFRLIQNNVIGSGIGLQSQVLLLRGKGKLDEVTNEKIESAWEKWKRKENCHTAGKLSFQDIERLAIRSVAESGEVIIRFVSQAMGTMKTPFALEIVESDLLVESYNAIAENGNEIRMGVEVNEWGRPVAYYFYARHPGDAGTVSRVSAHGRYNRIPAEEILHLFVTDRPGQTRGYPWLASAIMRLHQMQGMEEAEVIGARVAASLMGFIESPEGEPSPDDVVEGEMLTDFEPGTFKYLDPGDKVTIPQMNRPSGTFDPFMRAMLRGVGSGMGISYESLSKDYSQSTYSSARQALLEDRDNWRVLQQWMIQNFHQHVFEKWIDRAVLSGDLQLRGFEASPDMYYAVRWMPRGWSWIDPAKEVQAMKEAVRSGFMTQTEVIAQSGGDIEDLLAQRHREVNMADDLDLDFDTNPAFSNGMGTAQAVNTAAGTAEKTPAPTVDSGAGNS